MSYVNSTEFYNIPLFEETDLYNPMDYNNAMEAIDTAIHGAVTDAENAVSTAGSASDVATAAAAAVETLSGEVAEANGKITALQTNVLNLDNKVDDIKDDALDMICAFVEPTAQVGEDPESTHNYVIGDYFRYNDVLYKATAAIAIGDTIVPNTNCVATNVTTELLVSKSAADISYNSGTVKDVLDELTSNNLGTLVDIQSYTSQSQFTAPSDGYVITASGQYEAESVELFVDNVSVIINHGDNTSGFKMSIFVKKGSSIYATSHSAASVKFSPLQ